MNFQTAAGIILSAILASVPGITCAVEELSTQTTWNVSVDGSDGNSGSATKPFRTITRAAEAARPGDTVLVHPGVYRERVSPPRGGEPGKPITYRADKPGTAFIRGSEQWNPAWKAEGDGVFSAVPDNELFTTDDCYVDDANPFRVELSSTPYDRQGKPEAIRFTNGVPAIRYNCGQVIVNGRPWEQRPLLEEITTRPETWHFDPGSGKVSIHFGQLDPARQNVEITTRRRIFAPHILGLGHITVEGFVMEHCGNQYCTDFWKTPKWAQAGALGLRSGHHWIVRSNMIRYANTDGIDMGRGGGQNEREAGRAAGAPLGQDNLIEHNYIVDNGAGGINRESDLPSPWKPDEFFVLVKNDVGPGEPEAREGGAKVALTLDEWRAFWGKHGQENDRHSVTLEGMKVSYDQAALTLKVIVPFEPGGIKATVHERIDHDFQGVTVARDGSAKPGPFQSLKRGENILRVWDGLPLLAEGELPK